jgi:hypothetical protein
MSYTIQDRKSYWRIIWDDGAITTTSKDNMLTRADVESWLAYILRG